MRPQTRKRVEAIVEQLIAILDASDGDPDLEDADPMEDDGTLEDDGTEENALVALHMFEDPQWIATQRPLHFTDTDQ